MPIGRGRHKLGPENATLIVETRRMGAASKAGHDLVIEVTSWSAELDLAKDPAITLTADGGSLRVRDGSGGVTTLEDDDKSGIEQTIDEEVLKRSVVEFRSTAVELDPGGTGGTVHGELELAGARRPITFELQLGDERLSGHATIKQSDWGIKPYSALFGTLKVADEVEVRLEAGLVGALVPVDGLGIESSLDPGRESA